MTNNVNPLLQMQNIKKDFFGNQVLTDINFTLGEGEVLGLCGENGAGKSTSVCSVSRSGGSVTTNRMVSKLGK